MQKKQGHIFLYSPVLPWLQTKSFSCIVALSFTGCYYSNVLWQILKPRVKMSSAVVLASTLRRSSLAFGKKSGLQRETRVFVTEQKEAWIRMTMIGCESKHWHTALPTERPQWLFNASFEKIQGVSLPRGKQYCEQHCVCLCLVSTTQIQILFYGFNIVTAENILHTLFSYSIILFPFK